MTQFDLAKTDVLIKLFATPREARDDAWRASFFEAVVDASMASRESQVLHGPDGFPYFVLDRPPVGRPFTPFCVSNVLEHCTEQGLGIVVDPDHGPEWVFTYGDLFSLRAYGSFEGDPVDREAPQGPATEVLSSGTQVMIGAPSEQMLPSWARRVVGSFLKHAAHVAEPRVLLMVAASRAQTRNLVFNLHPEDFPSQADFQRVMNALGWFMPRNRSVVATSRASFPVDAFVPL